MDRGERAGDQAPRLIAQLRQSGFQPNVKNDHAKHGQEQPVGNDTGAAEFFP